METKDVILALRTKHGLSQDELASQIYVTRQAVSRWETGETIPNTETLKLLSKFFDVSINTLLGAPRPWICQCCGMPVVLCRWKICLYKPGRTDRLSDRTYVQRKLAARAGTGLFPGTASKAESLERGRIISAPCAVFLANIHK